MNKLLVALTVAGLSAPAMAQDTAPSVSFDTSVLAGTDFTIIDTDMSGGVTFDELAVLVPDLSQDDYNLIDADMNGELSLDELNAVVTANTTGGATSQ